MTDVPRRALQVGRLKVHFFVKRRIHKTPTQFAPNSYAPMRVSSQAATVFDLVRYADRIGGIGRAVETAHRLLGNLTPESWKAGTMKTTLDLPKDLVRTMKLRAVREGRKLKDVATELFRRGMARSDPAATKRTGWRVKLPLIRAKRGAPEFDLTG